MCVSVPRKVVRIIKDSAELVDGRTVRLGLVTDIVPGDYLEVYGDIALAKITKAEAGEFTNIVHGRNNE